MSKIIACMPCRNSAWVLGLSARALLMWVDHLVILDHVSTDATPDIIDALCIEYGPRVSFISNSDPVWNDMAQRQKLLDTARFLDATHIVLCDDDELVAGNLLPTIRQWVEQVRPGAILQLPWLQLRGSIDQVITSGMWAQQTKSVAFADDPAWHWAPRDVIAGGVAVAGYDQHHTHPMGKPYVAQHALSPGNRTGGLMHLQMVSERRLLWKHLHYKLTEHLRWPEKPVAQIEREFNATVTACQAAGTQAAHPIWWHAYADLMQYLDVDAVPWQEAEARRLLRENPGIEAGLTTYGLEI